MKVKSIAECSPWSILQYFWPALSDNWSWKPIFGLFESGHFAILSTFIKLPFVIKIFVLSISEWPLYTGFTVLSVKILLYVDSFI